MLFLFQIAAVLLPGYVRVGGFRLPVYGLFAAVGLLAALWLSQKTAPRAGLSANRLWDAGVFAVIAAFVASRLLLVAFDLRSFLKYPLLVLALPSLTYAGMLITAIMVWLWLRWKGIPTLDAADAWAPCAALLAAIISIGHFVEGTEAGMPTTLPWGVTTPGDTVLGRVHPVQLYAAACALALCLFLFKELQQRKFPGQIAAMLLMDGGILAFLLDMLRQPTETNGAAWLDPGQFVALAAIVAGGAVLLWAKPWPSTAPAQNPAIQPEPTFEMEKSPL